MSITGGLKVHAHTAGGDGGRALSSHLPPGCRVDYFGTGQPGSNADDFLECNGQNVSRTTYANLFLAIGTTWGIGDGATTFTVPDARRRSPVGKGGAGSATLGANVGNTGGEETHTPTIAEMVAHSHSGNTGGQSADHTHAVSDMNGGGGNVQGPGVVSYGGTQSGGSSNDHTHNIPSQGASTPFNVYHPAYVCGVWIKT